MSVNKEERRREIVATQENRSVNYSLYWRGCRQQQIPDPDPNERLVARIIVFPTIKYRCDASSMSIANATTRNNYSRRSILIGREGPCPRVLLQENSPERSSKESIKTIIMEISGGPLIISKQGKQSLPSILNCNEKQKNYHEFVHSKWP